jgi:hypothetical protein
MVIVTLIPNADGDIWVNVSGIVGGVAAWEAVATDDGDTTAIKERCMVGGRTRSASFVLSGTIPGSGVIQSVKVYNLSKKDNAAGTSHVHSLVYTHGDVYLGDESPTLTTSYVLYSHTWTTNPATGAAWTWAEISDLQAGVEMFSLIYSDTHDVYCTQVYAEVTYIPMSGSRAQIIGLW